jgi:hypothetical protein
MTRPIFMAKANVTSKLAFGRTQDVATLHSVSTLGATVTRPTCRGVSKNGKGESAHGRDSLLHYLMSYTTRHLMTLKHYKGEYGVVK